MRQHLPAPFRREEEEHHFWRFLPFLAGALVVALVWLERRSRHENRAAVGTAPAGAPPMRERDATPFTPPATPTPPPATSGAQAAPAPEQPEPVAQSDAFGTASPEKLADTGPDLADWVSSIVSDSDSTADEVSTASDDGDAASSTAPEATDAPVTAGSDTGGGEHIPTPAAESTAVTRDEGTGWIRLDGSTVCPDNFPIKGNASSRIFHRPGEPSYAATVPEICFASEDAAIELGYRARKH